MVTKSSKEVVTKYYCELCDYSTSRSDNYSKHLLTAKHKTVTTGNKKVGEVVKVGEHISSLEISCHSCDKCNKNYKSRKGLWSHKKKCSQISEEDELLENTIVLSRPTIDNNLVIELIKQNGELQKQNGEIMKQLVEIVKEPKMLNNGTINNNNTFNLQIFLNETCKDALNITEFVEKIKITIEDLINLSNKGYVTGVTDVIKMELNALDITKRPFHCTDVKRETIYFKNNDVWNKDTDKSTKMKQIVKVVGNKYRNKTKEWCQTNPDVRVLDSNENKTYHKLAKHLYDEDEKLLENSVQEIAKVIKIKRY
jgi:hypothetical protein